MTIHQNGDCNNYFDLDVEFWILAQERQRSSRPSPSLRGSVLQPSGFSRLRRELLCCAKLWLTIAPSNVLIANRGLDFSGCYPVIPCKTFY